MLVPASVPRFLACLLALIPLSVAAQAQDPTPTPLPVQMSLDSPLAQTVKPFSLVARSGKWFPVAVTLSNTGDPVSGTLNLHLTSNGEFDNPPNDIYCPVDLPANSRKVVWLYGRLDRSNVYGAQITFTGRGITTLSEKFPISEPDEGQRVVVTISDNDSGLGATLKGLKGPGLSLSGAAKPTGFNPSGSQNPLRPFESGRGNVPDRWFGLEASDMVILGDFPHSSLLPPQIEALRGYVMGGGTLLVMGGANAGRLRSSPLADLWPGQVLTSNTASAGEVASVVRRYVETPRNGADRLGGAPVVVSRLSLKPDAQLWAGTRDKPLYSSIDEGAGRVLFLGFDPSQPPFNGWSGQPALWSEVFSATIPLRRLDSVDKYYVNSGIQPNYQNGYGNTFINGDNSNNTPTVELLKALAKLPQLSMPPVSQIAWFLSLYVFVLVPLNYTVLRIIDRRELAWVTIPVIVAIFSVFAYAATISLRGTAILTRQVDVVQASLGSKVARTDSLLWIFSPKRRSYDISSASPNASVADFATDAGGKQGAFSVLQPADATAFKVENANVWWGTDRAFVTQSLVDLKDGIALNGKQVKNGTPYELNGAVWVQDHEVRSLGTIGSGKSVAIPTSASQKVVSAELMGAIISTSGIDSIFDTKTVANGIPVGALSTALGEGYGKQNEGALLVAWAKKPFSAVEIGAGTTQAKDLTLLVIRVPLSMTSPLPLREAIVSPAPEEPEVQGKDQYGQTIYKPAGNYFNCLLPPSKNWTLNVRGTGANQVTSPGSPPQLAPVDKNAVAALPFGLSFEVWDATNRRWVRLPGNATRDDSPAGGWNFSARISPSLPRQPDRLLRVHILRENTNAQVSNLSVVAN